MKKVLSLVLALVLVLGMIPTFAAGETGAELLQAHDFIVGDENGDLMVEKELTRAELAVLFAQMYGKLTEAEAFVAPADFTDAATFGWASNFISFAQANEWMVGYPDGTFQPNNIVTGKELLSALMQVLGYEVVWGTVVEDAAALGLVVSTEGAILRGAAFETMWVAVSEIEINGEEMTIGEKTGKIEPPAPVVVDLALVSVKAMNEGEVEVMFNNMIDEDAIDEDNFAVGTKTIDAVTLQEDGKTVIVEFLKGQLTNQTEYTLEISEIADVNGFVLEDIEADFTVTDFTAPVVEEVIVKGNKKIDIMFSEPVDPATAQILSNYKINGLLFGSMITVDGRTVSLDLSSRLADGVHTIVVNTNVTDFAGFKVVSNSTEFSVAKDTTAPALASVVSATQKEVVIMFNEAVADFDAEALVGGVATLEAETDDMTWTLSFAGTLPLAGTEITLEDVMDFYGNTTDEITFNVVPTIDLVRPEVKSVVVEDQDEIIVTFTKKVAPATGKTLVEGFTLTDEDDNEVTFTAAYDVVDAKDVKTVVVLTKVGGFDDGDYTLEVSGLEDMTPLLNKMIPYSSAIVVTDLTKPEIASAKVMAPTTAATGAIYIEFSEKVDAATALDKANYSYTLSNGTPVAVGSSNTVTLLGDAKTVKITVPKLATGATAVPNMVTVMNVTDIAGNKMVSRVESLGTFSGGTVTVTAPKATAVNKVKVTVPSNISPVTVTASDFVVKNGTDTIYVINAEYDGKTTITLTLSEDLQKDAKYDGNAVSVYLIARNLENIYGVKVAEFTTEQVVGAVVDNIKPEAVKVASAVYTSGTTTTAVITVNLDENLTAAATEAADGVVLDIDGKLVTPVVTYTNEVTTVGSEAPAKLIFTVTYTTDVELVGEAYSLKFYNNDTFEDTLLNNLADFTFTGTFK